MKKLHSDAFPGFLDLPSRLSKVKRDLAALQGRMSYTS